MVLGGVARLLANLGSISCLLASTAAGANECTTFEQESTATPSVLFDKAAECAIANEMDKAVLFMVLGQIRSMVDLTLFEPNAKEEKKKASRPYGRLYYQMGGSGPEHSVLDPERFIAFVESISMWKPDKLIDYEPEWRYDTAPSHERYILEAQKTKIFRINQLLRYRKYLQEQSNEMDKGNGSLSQPSPNE